MTTSPSHLRDKTTQDALRRDLDPNLAHLGGPHVAKSVVFLWENDTFYNVTDFALRAPKTAQDGPRWPQDDPKMTPRWLQDGPRWPQYGPRWAHMGPDGPRMAPGGPKMALRWPTMTKIAQDRKF